jgi:hypothetical protein
LSNISSLKSLLHYVRHYPNWKLSSNGVDIRKVSSQEHPAHIFRPWDLLGILTTTMRFTKLALLAPLVTGSPFDATSALVPRTAGFTYDGYHVYSITPSSAQEARDLSRRFSRHHTHPIRDTLSVAIPPNEISSFESLGLNTRLVNTDLGAHIRSIDGKAVTYNRALHKRGELPSLTWFDTYHPYADHLDYWDDLVHAFPKNAKKFPLGKSYENRTIYAFHLHGDKKRGGYGGKGKDQRGKPVILWHATVHAREV